MKGLRSWAMLTVVASLLLTGCLGATGGGSSSSNTSPYALDFGVAPTVVTAKQYGYADPGPSESPALKLDVTYPRLVSLLALSIWGADWPGGRTLDALPADVERLTKAEATIDPAAASWPGVWLYVAWERQPFRVPAGFTGEGMDVAALLLYCESQDQNAELYVLQGETWVQYATTVTYQDLSDYCDILTHPASAD